MSQPAEAIEVRGLQRSFAKRRPLGEVLRHPFERPDRVHALCGVDLSVARGELFGLLGPNGAGKTTLLKILCGLVLPGAGRAAVLGVDIRRERQLKRLIGLVQSDERSFYWRLTGRENLRFFGRLQGLRGRALAGRVDELLERVGLSADAGRRFGDYSSGMKQRAAIARSLLKDPPVLLMDEPTRALDPVVAARVRTFVRDELLDQDRRTVILATHNLREAEILCDRVAILARGLVRRIGAPAELRRWGLRGRTYRFLVTGLEGAPPPGLREVAPPARGGRWLEGVLEADEPLGVLLETLRRAGVSVRECHPHERDLEEVFGDLVTEEGDP